MKSLRLITRLAKSIQLNAQLIFGIGIMFWCLFTYVFTYIMLISLGDKDWFSCDTASINNQTVALFVFNIIGLILSVYSYLRITLMKIYK